MSIYFTVIVILSFADVPCTDYDYYYDDTDNERIYHNNCTSDYYNYYDNTSVVYDDLHANTIVCLFAWVSKFQFVCM